MISKFSFNTCIKKIIKCIFIYLLISISVPGFCQDFSNGIIDKEKVINSIDSVTKEKYPNADTVDINSYQWIKYNHDGTYVQWDESYIKILTQKGKMQFNSLSSFFTIPYNTTKFTLIEIIRNSKNIIKIDIEKNSRVSISHNQIKSNIYNPNNKILTVNIGDLQINDTVHYIIFDDFSKVRTPNTFSDYVVFESLNPIIKSEYTVIGPSDMPLKSIIIKDEIKGTIESSNYIKDKLITYKWTATNVPQAFKEPEMPPFYSQAQRLLISTVGDWKEISKWYYNLCKKNILSTTDEMKKLVDQLIKNKSNRNEKIMAIFSWVSQEIRYLGLTVEKDTPGYEPHPVNMTFERKAGVCRDKAALLVAMLNLAGFEAYPVLIMNGPKKDPEVPQPWFNHAVTCIKEPDGSYLLMDSTDENTKQLFPAYLNDQSYLAATPEGEKLLTSPIDPAENNMTIIDTDAAIDENGDLEAQSDIIFEGINDNIYRGYFSRCNPDERRAFFEKIIKKIAPGTELIDFKMIPENLLDTEKKLSVFIKYKSKDIRVTGKNTIMIKIIRPGDTIGMVRHLTQKMGLEKRKYPIYTKYACGIKESLKLTLNWPYLEVQSIPEYKTIDNKGIKFNRNIEINENIINYENIFQMKLTQYSTEQYNDLKQTIKTIELNNKKMPIFLKKQISSKKDWYNEFEADAVILNENIEIYINDQTSWTEKKYQELKILTYAGKKKFSDIHIDYNPFWEDIEVKDAMVVNPNGDIIKVNDQEINKMDAGWVRNAPRYPAEKTLVINFGGVETGSIIKYTIIRKKFKRYLFSLNGDYFYNDFLSNPFHRPSFSINGVFRYLEPVETKKLIINIDKNINLNLLKVDQGIGLNKIWSQPERKYINYNVKNSDKRTIHEFTGTNIEPIKSENYKPPCFSYNPTVFASSILWKNMADIIQKRLEIVTNNQDQTKIKASELILNKNNELEKITSIRDFVAKNIKKIPIAFYKLPLSQIWPADRTLSDGYGNQTDCAVLIFALLKEAGFKCEFVLSSWLPGIESLQKALEKSPSPEWFSNVLVKVITEENTYYLNDTDQYAIIGITPNNNRYGLNLKTGDFELIQSLNEKYNSKTDEYYTIKLDSSGDAIITKQRKLFGSDYSSFKKFIKEMPPEQKNRYHQELIAQISQSASSYGSYTTYVDSYPAIEEFSARVEKFATKQGSYLYFLVPGFRVGLKGVERDTITYPVLRHWFSNTTINVNVELPQGIKSVEIIPPRYLQMPVLNSGRIIISTLFKSESNQIKFLNIIQDIFINPLIIDPDRYNEVQEVSRKMSHMKTQMVLLKIMDNN